VDFSLPELEPWLLPIGKPNNLGLINNVIPAIIWKRNVTQSWAEFCERFGIPLITATTNSRDAKSINDVHDMLIGIGEASVGTFPQGTDIQIHEANRTDVFRVYSEFIQLNTDEISKQLVGSTMLSDQGSNRSQTEVHERTLDHKIAASDKRSITFMVNDQLLPLLQKQGYKVGEEDFFEFKTAEQEIDIDKLWNITSGLLTQGFPVEQDWISKTFNIPFEAKKNLNEKKKNEPINAVASLGEIKQRYPVSCCGNEPQAAAISSISRKLIELTKELALAVFGKKDYLGILGKLIATEGTALAAAMMKGFGKSESFTGADKLVMQMMEYNCFDFACSKTEERHYAVASRLIDYEKGAIKSKAEFLEQCLKDNQELNTNWLSTEYNLAVAVGQNSAAYVRALEDAKNGGTRFYEYQTAGDARVREAHQALDRKVFDILSPGDKAIWPPNGYGCRCEMVPHSGGAPVTDWDKGKALLIANDERYAGSQFMINRGDLKQVFTSKQFYRDIKGYPEKINQMTFDKYGLEKWEDFRNKLDELYIDKSITMRNADELFKKNISNSKMGLEDYLGKKIILTKTTFNRHKKRAELFPYVETVLKQPDEVWLVKHSKKGYQSNYIKHYKNMSLLVSTTLDETMEATQVETWFDIDYSNEHLNRRAGILIKSKKGADL
ncbi:phage portal protein family protein, partial [Ornithobacterium rhinotracheale]